MIGIRDKAGLAPRSIALTAVMAITALLAGPGAASAAASFVSASSGSDAGNDCSDQYAPCATIQHAIDELVPNPFVSFPSIHVAPGVYAEQLTVDKAVTLRGPNSRIDERGPEAVIEGGTGTAVTPETSNVTITGFTISSDDAGTPIRTAGPDVDRLTISENIIEGGTSSGIWLEAGGAETKILLNRIEADQYGIRLAPTDYSELTLWYNHLTGPVGSTGVFAGPGTSIDDFTLEGNEFATASLAAAITNGSIEANEIEPPAGRVGLRANLTESYVRENVIRGGDAAGCLQILGEQGGLDPSSQVIVSGNEFVSCKPYAVQLGPEVKAISATMNTFPGTYDGVVTDDSSPWDVTGSGIAVSGNRFVGLTHLGVYNAVSGELDARNNWWGCNGGPGSEGCDKVSSGVDASPNVTLTAEALEAGEDPWTAAPVSALNPGERAWISAHLKRGDGGEALNVSIITVSPVQFSSPRGSLSPVAAYWQNSHAGSVFTAGSQPGPAEVVVTMDNEQVEVPLTIRGQSQVAPPVAPLASPPPPISSRPQIRIRGGSLSLSGRNLAIGTIKCAQSACRAERKSAELRVGRQRFGVRLKMPTEIAAGGVGRIRGIVSERALGQILRHGTGTLTVEIKLTDASGGTAAATRTLRLRGEDSPRAA